MTRQYKSPADHGKAALALLSELPTTLDALRQAMGFASEENASRIMSMLLFAGQAFSCRGKLDAASSHRTLFFSTAASRDAHKAADLASKRARKNASAWQVRRREQQREAAALKREAKKVAKEAEKAAKIAASKAKRDQAARERKAATKVSVTVTLKGTLVAKVERKVGPAGLPGELDTSRARITKAPPPVDRFAVEAPVIGGFAHLKPGQYVFAPASCAARAA